MENFYAILGIAPNAPQEEIKKTYRVLAMRFHPDRNTSPAAGKRFIGIKKAYEILSDPVKRREYDEGFNNRIVIDPEAEAFELWSSLFNLYGIRLDQEK